MSMSTKVSQYLSESSIPQTVLHYQDAMRDVYGVYLRVHKKNFPLFRVLEDDLRELGFGPRSYAYGVANTLKWWVDKRGLKYIPMTVFCGEWAMKKYIDKVKYEYVDISKLHKNEDAAILLHDELTVARYYIDALIAGQKISIQDVVEYLRTFLSDPWLMHFQAQNTVRPISEALDILYSEYRVSSAKTYSDIAEAVRSKRE